MTVKGSAMLARVARLAMVLVVISSGTFGPSLLTLFLRVMLIDAS